MAKWGEHGTYKTLATLLTTPTPFKSQKILFKTEHWVQIYSNRNKINYISHSNIRAIVETRPHKLHNLLQFSPPFHPWHFIDTRTPLPPELCEFWRDMYTVSGLKLALVYKQISQVGLPHHLGQLYQLY